MEPTILIKDALLAIKPTCVGARDKLTLDPTNLIVLALEAMRATLLCVKLNDVFDVERSNLLALDPDNIIAFDPRMKELFAVLNCKLDALIADKRTLDGVRKRLTLDPCIDIELALGATKEILDGVRFNAVLDPETVTEVAVVPVNWILEGEIPK